MLIKKITILVCVRCGVEDEKGKPLHRHHQMPRSIGGNDLDGTMYVCKPCHDKTHLDMNNILYPFLRLNLSVEQKLSLKNKIVPYQNAMRKFTHYQKEVKEKEENNKNGDTPATTELKL